MSNLSNAYRHSEILYPSKCAIFSLTSLLMDTPNPGESLYANTVWCLSDFEYKTSLSSNQIARFRNNLEFKEVNLVNGKPGVFLVNMTERIKPNNEISWNIISDVHRSQVDIADLDYKIRHDNE